MANLKAHVGVDGLTYRYVECPRCSPTSIRLGPVSREDAEVALTDHLVKVHHEEPRGKRTAAGTAKKDFLASRRAVQCTEGTLRYYEAVLAPFWRHMGEKALRLWRRVDVEGFIAAHGETKDADGKVTRDGWCARSVQKFLTVLCTFTDWAIDTGLDVQPFAAKIRKPRVFRRQVEPLSGRQLRALLTCAPLVPKRPWLPKCIALAVYTGLSLGDIQALTYAECDADLTRIRRARAKGRRPMDIPICADLRAVLEVDRSAGGLVCDGIPESGSMVGKAVRDLYALAKVPRAKGQGLHFLRTSFISLGVEQTADIAAVAELVGDDVATVARFYTKSRDERRVAVVDAVAAVIRTA